MPNRDPAMPEPSQSAAPSQPVAERVAEQPVLTPATAGAASHQPQLGPDLQALIGQQLRAVYHEILNEPVPDRFVRLLDELAAKRVDRP